MERAKLIPRARLNVALFIETPRTPNPRLRRSSDCLKLPAKEVTQRDGRVQLLTIRQPSLILETF